MDNIVVNNNQFFGAVLPEIGYHHGTTMVPFVTIMVSVKVPGLESIRISARD